MTDGPCKDCSSREPGCHAKCDRYKAWKEDLKYINDARQKMQDMWHERASHVTWRKREFKKWKQNRR